MKASALTRDLLSFSWWAHRALWWRDESYQLSSRIHEARLCARLSRAWLSTWCRCMALEYNAGGVSA